jgi:hypothetical protein
MKTFITVLLVICLNPVSFGQTINVEAHRKNIVVLGYVDKTNNISLVGTGFLVEIDSISHLITAKHVVTLKGPRGEPTNTFLDSNLYAFYYSKSSQVKSKKISDIKNKYKVNWLIHKDSLVDVAMLPFDIDTLTDDLRIIPQKDFLNTKRLFETYDIYFVSFHPGLVNFYDFKPIFRTGTISRLNSDKTILLDAFAFPGNSGSPVFLKTSPIRYDTNTFNIGGDEMGDKFIGIIGAYIPYEDVAVSIQTNQPRVVFQENSGIALVWSIDFINTIINDPNTKKQISYIKNNFK